MFVKKENTVIPKAEVHDFLADFNPNHETAVKPTDKSLPSEQAWQARILYDPMRSMHAK